MIPRTETTKISSQAIESASTWQALPDWLASWGAAWGIPNLPAMVRVEFSPRLRRSLGRCLPAVGVIRLNQCLRAADHAMLREVVCHETAHIANWILHKGRSRSHGKDWQDLMASAGYAPRTRWPEASLPEPMRRQCKSSILFYHNCRVCGSHWVAKRSMKNWRCGACRAAGLDGTLVISTRPDQKDCK